MRYLILTYYYKADGKIDETAAVSRTLKKTDIQTANVILDFQQQRVVRARVGEQAIPLDWDRIVSYYYQYYANIIERLFTENGHSISIKAETPVAG
jgi:hypothetical protein